MCAILGIFGIRPHDDRQQLRREAVERSKRQRHRGPDCGGVHIDEHAILAHERLAIVDPEGGAQPLYSPDSTLVLAVNGEIYNHGELRGEVRVPYAYTTASDCEVINALYQENPSGDFLQRLNGIFAFALWDRRAQRVMIARDPIGVCSLYWGRDGQNRLWVASEMKALVDVCRDIEPFPPGHVFTTDAGLRQYYKRAWRQYENTQGVVVAPHELRTALEDAVHRQLMSDVPYGALLSGGLDSSIVTACAARYARRQSEQGERSETRWPTLHSFAIGLEGSPDLAAAQLAASAIGTVHHGFHFTVEEGWDVLPEVIRHIETYDITTVRASTPMYLLARRIKAMGVKMVLSGEGSDEIFGGYLYFHKAPSPQAFHEETVRKLDALHLYDCLRVNKSMLAWGVEARVPFLDVAFVDVAMQMDASFKMAGKARIEKAVLREAFSGELPGPILWRQKEQLSDGVGYGWIDGLKEYAANAVTDRDFALAAVRFPIHPPLTKEAYLYRRIFDELFPGDACARTVPAGPSIACSTPAAIGWDRGFQASADPSGRAVADVHGAAHRRNTAG